MRFTKAYCPRPPYGRGRARPGHKYRMSPKALAQRRSNLRIWRERGHLWRSHSESQAIYWLILQWAFDPQPKLPGRALARKLRVWEGYVRKVKSKALDQGADRLPAKRFTWDDLARARHLTEMGRWKEPGMFRPVRPVSPPRPTGVHVSPEEFERRRREAEIAAGLERLRKRLGKTR